MTANVKKVLNKICNKIKFYLQRLGMNTLIKKLDFGDKIYIHLQSSDILTIPYSYTKKLETSEPSQLQNHHLIGGGIGVHFDDIDEDISLRGIINYKLSHELKAS